MFIHFCFSLSEPMRFEWMHGRKLRCLSCLFGDFMIWKLDNATVIF